MERPKFLLLARVPADGVRDFQRYEDHVLALLAEHDGRLERRLRSQDGQLETHLIAFPSRQAFEDYRQDPRRTAFQGLLRSSGAQTELLELYDV